MATKKKTPAHKAATRPRKPARTTAAKTAAKPRAKAAAPGEGTTTIIPHLVCAGASDAIAFYRKAFGAVEEMRLPMPDGKLMHATVRIGGDRVMIADEIPDWGNLGPLALKGSPVTLHLVVADADATVARAVKAGARIVLPLMDAFWGDRYGKIEDPFGHQWAIAAHQRDVPLKDVQRASLERCGPAGQGN